jgi:hypothetical protein
LALARIPNLNASILATGTLNTAQIGAIDGSAITNVADLQSPLAPSILLNSETSKLRKSLPAPSPTLALDYLMDLLSLELWVLLKSELYLHPN